MIKINLLRNSGRAAHPHYPGTRTDFAFSASTSDSSDSKQFVLKILSAFILPAVLFFYERGNLQDHRTRLARLNAELSTVDAELQSKASMAEVLKQYVTEKTKLENQMETVRQLNKSRLRDIKALDSLQSIVPSKVWLTKVAIAEKSMNISGYSLNSEDISGLIKGLESSVFFNEVLLTSSTEEQSKQGSFKKFEIKCGVEAN